MAKITKTVVDNVASYAEEETTMMDAILLGATGPLKALSNNKNVFYDESVLGVSALTALIAGVALERSTNISNVVMG